MAQKKKFIEVEVPVLSEKLEVLGTPEELDKKSIKLDLSRKLRGRGVEICLEIQNQEGKLVAYPKRIELVKTYIRRMLRKRISTIEDSFPLKCQDIEARIKPILITRKKVSRAVRHNLRKTCKEILIETAKEKTYLELADEILYGNLQKEIYPKLKKVYPLSLCEIRVIETKDLEKAEKTVKEEVIEETTSENIKESEPVAQEEVLSGKKEGNEITEDVKEKVVKKVTKKKVKKTTKKKAVTSNDVPSDESKDE